MRLPVLVAFIALRAAGQSGYVTNAVGNTPQLNVIAPQMLASVVGTPAGFLLLRVVPFPVVVSTADVFIRPTGAQDLVRANVISPSGPLTFVVPAGIPYGTAEVIWRTGNDPYQWVNVTVARSNFALAPGALMGSPQKPVGLAAPARPGQVVTLAGSGLGYGMQVAATVAGQPAKVVYAGRGSPAGYDQIQIEIPASSATGCYVPLTVSFAGGSASTVISVTPDGSPCSHPLHLSISDLKNLDAGGSIVIAEISASSRLEAATASAVARTESANVQGSVLAASDLTRYFAVNAAPLGCFASTPQVLFAAVAGFRSGDFSGGATLPFPNLGDKLTLRNSTATLNPAGGSGNTWWPFDLPAPMEGTLAALPLNIVSAGRWTLTTPGTSDIAASSFDFTLPAPVRLSGTAPLTLRRDSDQVITWNGAGFDPNATATIFLNAAGAPQVTCTAPAASGSVTIPTALVAGFASGSTGSMRLDILLPAQAAGVPVKTTDGRTLVALVSYSTGDTRPVDFQ